MGIDERRFLDRLLESVPALCLLGGPNQTLFGIAHAADVAAWFADQEFVILGFEGFLCDGQAVTPLLDFIADFSAITGSRSERVKVARDAALGILDEWQSDVEFVEFVFEKP